MPHYRVTRGWSVAGYLTTEVEAASEEEAEAIEEARWDRQGVVPSLPHHLRRRIEDIFEEVHSVEEIPPPVQGA